MREAKRSGQYALIEATSNQVNQFGGYTGMTPVAFPRYVSEIAVRAALPREHVLLGGDHLGPNCWRSEPAAGAHGALGATDRRLRGRGISQDSSRLFDELRR